MTTPNETDDLFRKALDRLPDVPPPGVAFDAEALWVDLQRELSPKRRKLGFRAVAAGLILLLLAGWGAWLIQPAKTVEPVVVSVKRTRPEPIVPVEKKSRQEPYLPREQTVARRSASDSPRRSHRMISRPISEEIPPSLPAGEAIGKLEPEPEPVQPSAVPEAPTPKFSSSTSTAKARPRFRVVHINEVLAEEEAQPRLYRPEGMVRVSIGLRRAVETAPEPSSRPFILFPTAKQKP